MKNTQIQTLRYLLPSLLILLLMASGTTNAQRLEGMATYYADKFDGGTLSVGGTFRQSAYTAASKELDWGTVVEVTNLSNGKTTQVLINDCGPHAKGRLIDLSKAAARDLDFIKQGETKVRLRIIRASNSGPTCSRSKWRKKLKRQGKAIPPPPPPWDPTETASIKPINPVTPGPALANPSSPVPAGITRGMASYYPSRLHGRPTSTGEIYDRAKYTAASKVFTYGTRLEVTNIVNGAKTQVLVNDCGPHSADRIIDLSRAAADQIGLVQAGSAAVEIRVLEQGTKGPTCNRAAWAKTQRENTATLGPGQAAPPSPTVPGASRANQSPVQQQAGNLVEAYQLQVGAYGDRANAEAVVSKLVKAGLPDTYAVTSGKLTRVYTGLAATEKAAEAGKKAVAKAGYPKSKVVKTRVAPSALTKEEPAAGPNTYGSSSTPAPQPAPQREYDPTDILFGVQVGAFSAKANADKAMNALREAGVSEVYSAKVGKTYRVFAGKFYFQSQAETEKNKLRKMGFAGASVRRVQ